MEQGNVSNWKVILTFLGNHPHEFFHHLNGLDTDPCGLSISSMFRLLFPPDRVVVFDSFGPLSTPHKKRYTLSSIRFGKPRPFFSCLHRRRCHGEIQITLPQSVQIVLPRKFQKHGTESGSSRSLFHDFDVQAGWFGLACWTCGFVLIGNPRRSSTSKFRSLGV